MLNVGCVGAAAIRSVLKGVDKAGDRESEKTLSTMKYGLTHTVSTGADGYELDDFRAGVTKPVSSLLLQLVTGTALAKGCHIPVTQSFLT